MQGIIKNIIESDKCVTFLVWSNGHKGFAKTFTGPQYRNFQYWKDLKIGDRIKDFEWKDKQRGIIDADSPVTLES